MKCKLLAIFIIALVLLSLTSSRRVRRAKQIKGVSTVTRFGLGMVTALNGGDGKGLNFCFALLTRLEDVRLNKTNAIIKIANNLHFI